MLGLALTELLDGTVGAPGQLQCHVHPAALVAHAAVGLQGDARAGGLGDDGHELQAREGGSAPKAPTPGTGTQDTGEASPARSPTPTFSPLMNRCFSLRFTWSMDRPCSARDSKVTVPSGLDTTRPFLPVICGRSHGQQLAARGLGRVGGWTGAWGPSPALGLQTVRPGLARPDWGSGGSEG